MILITGVFVTADCFGWSEAGHKITASIAYRRISQEQRRLLLAILRKHPRFAQDFQERMPEGLNDEDRDERLFQQASIWPDIARGFTGADKATYHHGTWHYINRPVFLSDDDRTVLDGRLRTNISMQAPMAGASLDDINVVQAITHSRSIVLDPQSVPADRAVHLCWWMHLVGDIHQPLHSVALFSRELFPNGYRGGNQIKTTQHGNLHALWDTFPGGNANLRTAHSRAVAWMLDSELKSLGESAGAETKVPIWLDESNVVAKSIVYDPEVLAFLRSHEGRIAASELPVLNLSEDYLRQGGAVSRRRVVEAGYRLGSALSEVPRK